MPQLEAYHGKEGQHRQARPRCACAQPVADDVSERPWERGESALPRGLGVGARTKLRSRSRHAELIKATAGSSHRDRRRPLWRRCRRLRETAHEPSRFPQP
jgi:hypothetical protein